MGSIDEKSDYLKVTKQHIKRAIQSKGIEVSDSDTFRSYVNKINSIYLGIPDAPNNGNLYGRKDSNWELIVPDIEVMPTEELPIETNAKLVFVPTDAAAIEIVPEAPVDGKQYVRKDTQWREPMPVAPLGGYNRALFESLPHVHFNEQTNFYEVWADDGGLTDVTEEQMINIYNISIAAYFCNDRGFAYKRLWNARALIPINYTGYNAEGNLDYIGSSSSVEYIRVRAVTGNFITQKGGLFWGLCANARKLRKIADVISIKNTTGFIEPFAQAWALEEIYLRDLKTSIYITESSKLKKESILFLIKNSIAESEITIKLHPIAYDMAMADADIQQALAEKTFVSLAK